MNKRRKNKFSNYLKVIPLGGAGGVNKNMFIWETPKDILVIDCGIDFPETENETDRLGLPDIGYLKKNLDKIRGIMITHGHEDHYGALPFVLIKGFDRVPVFAPRLALEFIKEKLKEFGVSHLYLNVFSGKEELKIGDFRVFPFRVNHSVSDTMGFCLYTPVGKIFHVADFKFDLTPVDGKRFDFQRAVSLAQGKVLALFSDCLGATEEGHTQSEKEIEKVFEEILQRAKGQVLITTLSSNISRIQQAINASLKFGRQICILGRSIEQSIEIARKLSLLKVAHKNLVSSSKAKKTAPEKITYLIAGSYGQTNSALSQLAEGHYHGVRLIKGAVVIFSADPSPPGVKDKVDRLVDQLTLLGATVHYYEIQENLHVSGHGSKEDLKLLLALVKPRFAIPIGGDPRHQRAYSFLAQEMNIRPKNIFELLNGEILEFRDGKARLVGKIELKDVLVAKN